MNIFLTGGAGFIGSHVADLFARNHSVTIFDNMNSAVRNTVKSKNIKTITGDIRDLEALHHAMKKHDLVIALAVAHLRVSLSNPLTVHDINTTGTLNTLISAKKNDINRFIYISSSEAYGSANDTLMSENHVINPTTVYGVSKYVGELYTQQFGIHENLNTTIIRPFNTYGPRSHFDGQYGEVIPRMVIRVRNGLSPIIFGDGNQTRDFTYVTDTAQGILNIAISKKTNNQTLNIAYGQEISIKHIASIICNTINPKIKPIYKKPRPQDVQRHAADTSKAKQLIHWKPKISIEQGIQNYIDWQIKTYPHPEELLKLVPDINW